MSHQGYRLYFHASGLQVRIVDPKASIGDGSFVLDHLVVDGRIVYDELSHVIDVRPELARPGSDAVVVRLIDNGVEASSWRATEDGIVNVEFRGSLIIAARKDGGGLGIEIGKDAAIGVVPVLRLSDPASLYGAEWSQHLYAGIEIVNHGRVEVLDIARVTGEGGTWEDDGQDVLEIHGDPDGTSDDDDDGEEDGDDEEPTEIQIANPNGINVFHTVLLGNILNSWPNDDSDHIEPACVDDDKAVRICVAWSQGSIAIQIGEQATEFRFEPESDEFREYAQEQLRTQVRALLEAHPHWGLNGEVLEEAVTLITTTDLDDVLDGDEDERGWRCESGQYEVSGYIGSWGELDEDGSEAEYAGGFYLSVVGFTNPAQVGDAENLSVSRNARGDVESVELHAAVSDLDHSYVVAARRGVKSIAGKRPIATPSAIAPQPLPVTHGKQSAARAQAGPRVAEHAVTRSPPPAKPTNWIALVIVAGLVLSGLMYAYGKFIAPKNAVPQAADTAQSSLPTPAAGETAAALAEVAPPAPATRSDDEASPSFDCATASTETERMICGTPQLGALDAMLGANYRNVMSADIGDAQRAELKATQRRWLATRNACADMRCLADAYMQRIDAICAYRLQSGALSPCVALQKGPTVASDESVAATASEEADAPSAPQAPASNPGFDCSLHKGVIEQAICADRELGELHREMAEKYAALAYAGVDSDVLKATQDFWMESRNRCTGKACLAAAYQDRIRAFDEYAASKH